MRIRLGLGALVFSVLSIFSGRVYASASTPRARVELRLGAQQGSTRTYVASVTRDGSPVVGANLDIGGLGDNPDLRVPTTPLLPIGGEPGRYRATLDFPANGWWVLTIRGSGSIDQVDLFSVEITGVASTFAGHDSPSRRALATVDPTFAARYDPTRLKPGEALTASEIASYSALHSVSHSGVTAYRALDHPRFGPMLLVWAFVHTLGAAAWALSVFGLVLANRLGPGGAQVRILTLVTRHYLVLAGGGLAAVVLSGLTLAKDGPLGPSLVPLRASGLELAYLLVFTAKMALVAAAAITTLRIGLLLRRMPAPAWRVRSLAAAAETRNTHKVLRLAEANAAFLILVLGCVVVLNNLHHAIR